MTNFEIATRVPLIMAGPGISKSRARSIAELVDLYPTVCELSGVPLPEHLESESLTSAIYHRGRSTTLSQYSRFSGKYTSRTLRTDRYRSVIWETGNRNRVVHQELYDHHLDPHDNNKRGR